ncbi:MAG: flippase [Armatimonadota bacterium]
MSNARLVSRNFAASFITQLISWGLTFMVTLYLPSYAGARGMGSLAVAGAFVAIFGVLASLGTSSVLIKEIARDRTRAGELLCSALFIRIPLSLLLGVVAYIIACILDYSSEMRLYILVALLGMLFAAINDALGAVLQGMENLTRQGLGVLADKLLLSALIIVLIKLKQPLWTIAAVGIVTACVSITVNLYSLRSILPTLAKWPGLAQVRYLVTAGVAFIGISIFTTLYGQADPLILSALTNEQTVGWYAVAARLVGTTLFVPAAVNAALLPTLARLYTDNRAQFKTIAQQMLTVIMLVGMPVAVLLIVVPHRLLELLHYPSEFAGAIPVLRIGGVSAFLYYMTVIFGSVVIASDRQARMLVVFAKSCLVGIPLCFLLTHIGHRYFHNGALGAMLGDVLVELYLVFAFINVVKEYISIRSTLLTFVKLVVAAIPLALLLLFATSTRNLAGPLGVLWALIPGLVLYLAGCFWLRCFDPAFFRIYRTMLQRA